MPFTQTPINIPAGYIAPTALAFAGPGGVATIVDDAHPLPITMPPTPAQSQPLVGEASASGTAGPFVPDPGRAIRLVLSGVWAGSVQIVRSTDAGTTRVPLTLGGRPWASFTANANEVVAVESEAGVSYHLQIMLTTGTVVYRVTQ